MGSCHSCNNVALSRVQVDEMFRQSEQVIEEEIGRQFHEMKSFWLDYPKEAEFPLGSGYNINKMIITGDVGPQFDAHDAFSPKVPPKGEGLTGEVDACAYPKAHTITAGFYEKSYNLAEIMLESMEFCLHEITHLWKYMEVQNAFYQNLANISRHIKEQYIRNTLIMMSVKHIAIEGWQFNTANPHEFPLVPSGINVGRLTYKMLSNFYYPLVAQASQHSFGSVDGSPQFLLVAHPETIDDMIYEDPEIRKDIQECDSESCSLLKRVGIRERMGPFSFFKDMYAPRYNRDADGRLCRVFPFERNVPTGGCGFMSATNPEYHSAEFEYVMILTQDIFRLRHQKAVDTVGGQTKFGRPEYSLQWRWFNEKCKNDPEGRMGHYFATGMWGAEPMEFSTPPGILVTRRPDCNFGIDYWGAPKCPEESDKEFPVLPQECPCPKVVDVCPTSDPQKLYLTFNADVTDYLGAQEFLLANGTTIDVTVGPINPDNTCQADVVFPVPVEGTLDELEGFACSVETFCESEVTAFGECTVSGAKAYKFDLCQPLKCMEVGDVIRVQLGDGEWVDMTVVLAEPNIPRVYLDYVTAPDVDCGLLCKGVRKLCCDPANADSADCDGCVEEEQTCDPEDTPWPCGDDEEEVVEP